MRRTRATPQWRIFETSIFDRFIFGLLFPCRRFSIHLSSHFVLDIWGWRKKNRLRCPLENSREFSRLVFRTQLCLVSKMTDAKASVTLRWWDYSNSIHNILCCRFYATLLCYIIRILTFDVHIFSFTAFLYSKCTQNNSHINIPFLVFYFLITWQKNFIHNII